MNNNTNMNQRIQQLTKFALISAIVVTADLLIFGLYCQHQAIVHHAAHYEVNSWGVATFHWNDEYAQTPFIDPVNDSPTPPPFKQ